MGHIGDKGLPVFDSLLHLIDIPLDFLRHGIHMPGQFSDLIMALHTYAILVISCSNPLCGRFQPF